MKLGTMLRRGGILITLVTACSLMMSGPASACSITSQYDDGGDETSFDLDFTDDTAIKRLDGPQVAVSVPGFDPDARLEVKALAYGCATSVASYTLVVNGIAAISFDPCNVWPVQSTYWNIPGWASLNFPGSLVHTGVNTFQILDTTHWDTNNAYLAVDSNSDYGRSDMRHSGADQPGELMWRLSYSALVCA